MHVIPPAPCYPPHPLNVKAAQQDISMQNSRRDADVGGGRQHLAGNERCLYVGSHTQQAVLSRGK